MSLKTFSTFFYGHIIDDTNFSLDFNEGALELQASLRVGDYTLDEYAQEISVAMTSVGAQAYTATVNRLTRRITISAAGNFTLLIANGTRVGTTTFTLAGFTGVNLTGTNTYLSDLVSGFKYEPQFIIQDYIASQNFRRLVKPSVNKSASGRVEVVRFGEERFIEARILFVTDIAQPSNGPIKNNASGLSSFRQFLEFATQKAKMEFMADIASPSIFEKVLLESTPESQQGTDFKIEEMIGKNLPGYYESGILRFRKVT